MASGPLVDDGIIHTDGSTILAGDDKSGIAAIMGSNQGDQRTEYSVPQYRDLIYRSVKKVV
ncbi:MAG: hypothetical protein ACLR78_05745 [Roseburia sp.]